MGKLQRPVQDGELRTASLAAATGVAAFFRCSEVNQRWAGGDVSLPDIVHDFPIKAAASQVFCAVSTPAELDRWWTVRSTGEPRLGAGYELWFGPEYDWRARVTRCKPEVEFELELTRADKEWVGTKVGFQLDAKGGATQVRFHHLGWPAATEHYRVSCYCWAMYLRVLRRYLEYGESVPYERRLDV